MYKYTYLCIARSKNPNTKTGVTWQQSWTGARFWRAVASSSDGTQLYACASPSSYIVRSNDSGQSWVDLASAGQRDWWGVASSADGMKLVAVAQTDYVWTSTDGK